MVTYVNDLRLSELATGEGSGTWGTTTNTNLELIGEALGYGTEQSFSSDADATTTIGDGVSDPARAMYFKVTSAGSLTATRTLTIAPNTVSRVMFIENATTGSQSIAISQGSGASVTILTGKTAVVYLDGAGATAAVVDAMSGVDPGVTDTLTEVLVAGNTSGGTNIELSTTDKVQFRDAAIYINSSVDGQLDIVADTEIQIAATTVDLNGNLDVSGTALVTGVLTTTAATVFNGGFASNADSTLGTDKKVQFRDSAIYINSSVDGQLDIVADTEIQIAATTIDINGTIVATTSTDQAFPLTVTNSDADSNTYIKYLDQGGQYWTTGINYASNDFVMAYGGTNVAVFANAGGLTVTSADNLDTLSLISTDADANVGPNLRLYRNSGSPANSDALGRINAVGRNDASQDVIYSTIETYALDVSDGTESAVLNFNVMQAGTSVSFFKGNNTEVVVNDDSRDLDFRVESDSSTHALFVDGSSGNVGIGVVPETWYVGGQLKALQIGGSVSLFNLFDTRTVLANNYYLKANGDDTYINTDEATQYYQESGIHAWFNAPSGTADTAITWSESMRIDASSNLLVGKTASNSTVAGAQLNSNGLIIGTTSETNPLLLNRLSTDGNIITMQKDGATKGSIGTTTSAGGTRFAIGAVGDPGIIFAGTGVFPATEITAADNATDLGSGNYRWKDLYLSSGVYLGGTVAANLLDDYEEGTFTATLTADGGGTITLSDDLMRYTKIGRVVTVSGLIICSAISSPTGDLALVGLPFTVNNNTDGEYSGLSTGSIHIQGLASTITGNPQLNIPQNSTQIAIDGFNGTTRTSIAANISATTQIRLCATYTT
jgi:hypothetical protein